MSRLSYKAIGIFLIASACSESMPKPSAFRSANETPSPIVDTENLESTINRENNSLKADVTVVEFETTFLNFVSERTISLTNSGAESVSSIAVAITAPFDFKDSLFPGTGGDCETTIAPGASCKVVITFRPQVIGNSEQVVRFAHNDSGTSVALEITLKGSSFSGKPGHLDTTFATQGFLKLNLGASSDEATALAVGADGTIWVGGRYQSQTNSLFIYKIKSDGSFDESFGVAGVARYPFYANDVKATGLLLQPDGKVVLTGYVYNNGQYDLLVMRFSASGLIDMAFGSNGFVYTDVAVSDDIAYESALQNDGKIILVGSVRMTGPGISKDSLIVRYNPNGTLDESFGFRGRVTSSLSAGEDSCSGIKIQPDGKIVLGCLALINNFYDFSVQRLMANGTLDASFGTNGVSTVSISSSHDYCNDVLLTADDKIICGGYYQNGIDNDVALARFSPAGSLDETFAAGGKSVVASGPGHQNIYRMAQQSDGKILMVGSTKPEGNMDMLVVRLTADGAIDPSFEVPKLDFSAGGEDSGEKIIVQPDGRIVIVGHSTSLGIRRAMVVRLWP